MLLVPLMQLVHYPFLHIVSGDLFSHAFNPEYDVGALDQSTLQKGFFLFTVFALLVAPYIAAACWMTNMNRRPGYWVVVAGTIALDLCLLTILYPASYLLGQYIYLMGFTIRRMIAVLYSIAATVLIAGIPAWVAAPYDCRDSG